MWNTHNVALDSRISFPYKANKSSDLLIALLLPNISQFFIFFFHQLLNLPRYLLHHIHSVLIQP